MISGIEKAAEYIVDYLEWAEEATVSEIIEEVEVPQPVVLMSIGYLVNQGKIKNLDEEKNILVLNS